jgi:hypothetical protein
MAIVGTLFHSCDGQSRHRVRVPEGEAACVPSRRRSALRGATILAVVQSVTDMLELMR